MSSMNFGISVPGIRADRTYTPREVLWSQNGALYLPAGRVIDGSLSRDPLNGTDKHTLRPGQVMGKISASGLYAPAILALSSGALASTGTSLASDAATATELVRRIGASGTFKLTGPPTAAGTVRTLTATYSAVNTSTGAITITALGVNEVQTITPTTDGTAGTFVIRILRPTGVWGSTGPLAHNSSVAAIQTALDLASGVANGVVASTEGSAAPFAASAIPLVLTFSGTGYAALPQTLVEFNSSITSQTCSTVTRTTAGVDGRFVTGSFIQPDDGSEAPQAILDEFVRVTDVDGNDLDCQMSRALVAGIIDDSQILNWPADTALQKWLIDQLAANTRGQWIAKSTF